MDICLFKVLFILYFQFLCVNSFTASNKQPIKRQNRQRISDISIYMNIIDKDDEILESYMKLALRHAQHAFREGEVPIGAVIVDGSGTVIASSRNKVESRKDPTAHAEINCIRDAAEYFDNWRLLDCTLYTTLEPCPMCMSAANAARIKKVVFAANDPRLGAAGGGYLNMLSNSNPHPFHNVDIHGGIMADDSKQLMQRFFRNKREKNSNDDGNNILISRDTEIEVGEK